MHPLRPTVAMDKIKLYRTVLLLSIVMNLVVGVIIFVSPDSFTSFAGQPEAFPKTWPRHWGAQLWAINFLYLRRYTAERGVVSNAGCRPPNGAACSNFHFVPFGLRIPSFCVKDGRPVGHYWFGYNRRAGWPNCSSVIVASTPAPTPAG